MVECCLGRLAGTTQLAQPQEDGAVGRQPRPGLCCYSPAPGQAMIPAQFQSGLDLGSVFESGGTAHGTLAKKVMKGVCDTECFLRWGRALRVFGC